MHREAEERCFSWRGRIGDVLSPPVLAMMGNTIRFIWDEEVEAHWLPGRRGVGTDQAKASLGLEGGRCAFVSTSMRRPLLYPFSGGGPLAQRSNISEERKVLGSSGIQSVSCQGPDYAAPPSHRPPTVGRNLTAQIFQVV